MGAVAAAVTVEAASAVLVHQAEVIPQTPAGQDDSVIPCLFHVQCYRLITWRWVTTACLVSYTCPYITREMTAARLANVVNAWYGRTCICQWLVVTGLELLSFGSLREWGETAQQTDQLPVPVTPLSLLCASNCVYSSHLRDHLS